MENAIVYLQEKGYIPKLPTTAQTTQQEAPGDIDFSDPAENEKVTKMLQERGLLPRK